MAAVSLSHRTRRDAERELGDDLARGGKAVIVGTTGRTTGRPARAAVGFIEAADGAVIVAAGDPSADWALNLFADPRCNVTLEDRTWAATAEVLEDGERNRAIAELILRYGTPAERLGTGPAFRLVPDATRG